MPNVNIIKADIRDRLKTARTAQYLLDLATWGEDVRHRTESIAWGLKQDQYPFSLEDERAWLAELLAACPTPERRYFSPAQGDVRPRPLGKIAEVEWRIRIRQKNDETRWGRRKPRRPRP